MKALVTGATGFIGSHLVEALLQNGAQVRCLIRKVSDLKWLKGLPAELVCGDCLDKNSLKQGVKDVDLVFHLAAVTKAVDQKTYFEVNGLGTENLIHACFENNNPPPRFIYLSSQAAAGPCCNGGKKKESDPCEPVSPYGRSKRLGEELALAHSHELPLLILRPSAAYGPRDKDVYALFKCLSKKINPCLSGHAQHISMCYVEDVVRAILLAGDTKTKSGDIFFISDGHDYRMEEIGDAFAQAMEVNAFRIRVPKQLMFGIAFFSEYLSKISRKPSLISKDKVEEMVQKNWICDITKARTLLGFEPQISLAQGAKLTFGWYREQNWL